MPDNIILTVEDPSGATITVTEKTQDWTKYLSISFRGISIFNERETAWHQARGRDLEKEYTSSIRIKSSAELISYLEEILDPDLLDQFISLQNGENIADLTKHIKLGPTGVAAGYMGIMNNHAYISGKPSRAHGQRRVRLDYPIETLGSLNAFLREYR